MAPPPSTPSPRRFITSKPEKATPKPPSNLRFQTIATPQPLQPQSVTKPSPTQQFATPKPQISSRPSSSHQFAATPKFSFTHPKRLDVPLRSPSKARPAVAQFTPQEQLGETIEDASQEGYEASRDQDNDAMILDSITRQHQLEQEDEEEESYDYPSSPKRPRLAALEHTTPRRFVFGNHPPTPSTIALSTQNPDQISTHTLRPQFIKPPPIPVEHAEPLPEAFSPHRRGQKFIPGGMASTVRQWILDASQSTSHIHTRRPAGGRGELWPVHVLESKGSARDGVVLVRGQVEGREVRLILPGQGKKRENTDRDIAVGDVVGIGNVRWDLEVSGETWTVCVEWRVIDA